MLLFFKQRGHILRHSVLILLFLVGCADRQEVSHIKMASAPYLLGPAYIKNFRAGRSKCDILEDVDWQGVFLWAGEYRGESACAIWYEVVFEEAPDNANSDRKSEGLYAIFVDDKFVKWIIPPKPIPEDMETVVVNESSFSRPKPIKIGDIRYLIQAVEAAPVKIADVERQVKARPPTPSQVDPGLTIAFRLLYPSLKASGRVFPTEEDYKRNADLRDQFNASRLDIGMTEAEVEAVFNSKPIESGEVQAGSFRIYGSNQSFNLVPAVHFSNILLLFKEGKASVIYSLPSGQGWRGEAQKSFIDFPR